MSRKALLIGGPGARGASDYLSGVERDLDNYERFLTSALGGAWSSSEIITLNDPTTSIVEATLGKLRSPKTIWLFGAGRCMWLDQISATQ